MTDTLAIKNQLRSALRLRRKSLSNSEQHTAAKALTRHVVDLPLWRRAQHIALYLAADGEIDTTPLQQLARSAGKHLFLPVITSDNGLSFARWEPEDVLANNCYNIPEPPAGAARCPVSALDIVFLPLVGWDLRGGRLGMGGGFYDRTLSEVRGPLLVGLAHDNQQVEEIPRDHWDIGLDYIVTDAALYRSQGT
jgi:5-formyltetrahydrofolate cyclo-ligase